MEADFSKIFSEKYFRGENSLIEVTTKNGRKITGVILSFFHGETDCNEPFIIRWHIAAEKHKMTLGVDAFGFHLGEIVDQKDIESIKFLDDDSIMQFK